MQRIAQLWDLFIQAESSSYEKSVWYDVFLSQFIADINNGKTVDEILTFCNLSGAGTLIGCELLSDIDQVCSQPGDGEDLEPLKQYLFNKGWKALAVLLNLGHQSFSCSHELANLLISLFPVCLEVKGDSNLYAERRPKNKYLHLSCDDIDSCFTKAPLKRKFSNFHRHFFPRGEFFKSRTNSSTCRNRRHARGTKNGRRAHCEQITSESESTNNDIDLIMKSCPLKIKLDPMDFDYFTNVVRSDDETGVSNILFEPKKHRTNLKISPADFIDDSISDIINCQVSPFELSMLIIQLLISLCRSETGFSISADNSFPVCSKSVKFALENLCSVQFGSVSLQNVESHEAADLKYNLTLLLAISLDRVLGFPDITTNVILTGIFPMMLRVLEDSVCKLTSDHSETGFTLEGYERDKQLEVVFGLMCSSITFLLSLLLQNPTVNYVRSFLELFKIFIESSCGKLIVTTVHVLIRFGNVNRAKKVIDLLGQLICGLKKARKDIVSPHICKRLKQKRCKTEGEMHHHHDLFGNVYNPSVMGSNCQQNCCVSSLFMIFVRLLQNRDKLSSDTLNKILKVMNFCGTCCCFTSKSFFQYLTEIIQNNPQKTRILVYQLLENTIYPEMGFYITQNKARISCVICFKRDVEDVQEDPRRISTVAEYLSKRATDMQSDRGSIQSEKSHQSDSSALDPLASGKFLMNLDLFYELLQSKEFRIVHGITSHLLKCAPKMSCKAKRNIFFNIFLPTFLMSKNNYMSEKDDVSVFRILSSLSVFSSLLDDTSLAEQFVSLGGLTHTLELVSIHVFSKHCCSVLEKTIVVALLAPEADSSSFTVLRDAVESSNNEFFKIYGHASKVAADGLKTSRGLDAKKRQTMENIDYKIAVKRVDVLQQVCTFWRTYANIILFNPLVRKFFSDALILKDCQNILQISLDTLTRSAIKSSVKNKVPKIHDHSEGYLFTKLIESLLTFVFSITENDDKGLRERETVINQLSDTLLPSELRNVDARRLAEVLLKCSLVQPSHVQSISYGSSPKLPLLTFWSAWDDDGQEVEDFEVNKSSDSSSLEENYIPADEGYDADIELRDPRTSHSDMYETNSSCTVSDSVTLMTGRDCGVDKPESKNSNTIVHPKLCSLAIDLLIKLYQEKFADEDTFRKGGARKSKSYRGKFFSENSMDKKDHFENIRKHRSNNRNENAEEIGSDDSEKKVKKNEGPWKTRANELKPKDGDEKFFLGFISIFQRLVSLCRDKIENCVVLSRDGLVLKLLTGFRKCLSERKECYSEFQRVILDLITILSSFSISKEELAYYLGFFKMPNPPVDHLLNPLASIVSTCKPEPIYSVQFPASPAENLICHSESDIGNSLRTLHKHEGTISCWSLAALSVPFGYDSNWSMWMLGFSVSAWVKIERKGSKNNCEYLRVKSPKKPVRKTSKAESHISNCSTIFSDYGMMSDIFNNDSMRSSPDTYSKTISLENQIHIFTVGNESLAIECWSSTSEDVLLWRLSRSDSHGGCEILAEALSEHCIPPGAWHFLAINVKDSLQRKKTIIEVTLIIDGWNEVKTLLPFNGILLRKPRPSSLLLGHQAKITKVKSYLGSFMVFACPVFTKERALYLFGLGPNCVNLTECQIGKQTPNFTCVFNTNTLKTNISWDKIFKDEGGTLKELQDNLLLVYRAENINIAHIYSPASTPSNILFPGFRPNSGETRGAQRIPFSVLPNHFASVTVNRYEGLILSARLLGGSATFLFLFARVIEVSKCPEEQAKSLYLLLKLVQSDCDIFNDFIRNGHFRLLHKVFQSSRTASGPHFVKAMLDASCDKSIVQNNAGTFQVIQHSDAVIVNSFLISTILDSWKDWRSTEQQNEVLRIFFLALNALLKDDHPFREFNVLRLNGVSMIDKLLSFCKERLLYEERRTLDDEVFYSLLELVRSLMGAPPDFSHIVSIMDCLIILHPVHATYVTHAKNSFYFILSAGQTYFSEGPVQEASSFSEKTEKNNAKDKIVAKHSENLNRNFRMEELRRRSFTGAVDPAKLNKVLTNLKLKKKRLNEETYDSNNDYYIYNDDLDRCSDDFTFDSGIAGSYRETAENVEETNEVILRARDGSRQNLTSFFPSMSLMQVNKQAFEEANEEEKYANVMEFKDVGMIEESGAQCIVSEGLLLLLRDTILVLPDNMAFQILNHVVKLEVLLVFANHRDHRVRSAVIKVFSSYLQRCSDEELNKFVKMKGFHHLANQISLFPASLQLIEDCVQLITRCSASLDDEICISAYDTNTMGMACIPPLLALLPRSVHDPSLAHKLINFLLKFYAKDASCSRLLLENGLLETLVKSLVASAHVTPESRKELDKDPVVTEIVHFFTFILSQALSSPGIQNMQIITDMKLQLYYVYRLEKESCGFAGHCSKVIRDTICKILEAGLDVIQSKITGSETFGTVKSSFLSNVLSGSRQELSQTSPLKNSKGQNKYTCDSWSSSSKKSIKAVVKELTRGEISDRFKILVTSALEFFIYSGTVDGKHCLSQTEFNFIYHLLPMMFQALSSTLGKRSSHKRTACGIYWSNRDILKTQISEFVVWLLSPRQIAKTRIYLVNTLISESKARDLILVLLQTHPQVEQKFSVYMWDLMYNTKLTNTDLRSCQELRELLLQWGVVSPQAIGTSHDAWRTDSAVLLNEADKQISSWEKHMESAIMRCITKHDAVVKTMSDEALSMTCLVVEAQNVERKCLIEKMRMSYSENIQITAEWSEIITQLSHERAVWFFEHSYPAFWQLDPTEGPSRVRKRLSRCYIGVDGKYLLPSHRYKLDRENNSEPLAFLFENHIKVCSAMKATERLHCNEKIRTMSLAKVVTPSAEIPGELLIGEKCIYFVADDNCKYFNTFGISNTVWPFEDVREIHPRRYQLQEKAIEVFLVNGKTYLIAFQTCKEREEILVELLYSHFPNKHESDNLGNIMQMWREGLMTNYDYLILLNKGTNQSLAHILIQMFSIEVETGVTEIVESILKSMLCSGDTIKLYFQMAGRSFNDLMQYPVFPFVLSDYKSPTLDLTNKMVYRNFRKPMAIQEKKNEQHYINNYNELLNGLKQVALNQEPYHYGSHYSNSGTVLHFLVRLPPFTKMLLQYQDRNFDLPDRTFHSIHTTWRLASCDSTTDVKEMLPEFFFLPEFLTNSQGFNFGVRQNGEVVDNVELPPWCKNDARKFILVHRQALESDYVTENLPYWIDLVFGYKQTGKAAIEAINVFHPATYCGFNVESISDPVERTAWETMVKTYGQTPKQLFKHPHPLAVQTLVEAMSNVSTAQIIKDVKGLKWGNYVGSPVEPEPSIILQSQCRDLKAGTLLPLESNDILVLPRRSISLLKYNREKGLNFTPAAFRKAVISWSLSDNILRLKMKKEVPPFPVLYVPSIDPISICHAVPECDQIWIGHHSGNISVHKFKFLADRDMVELSERPVLLQGHSKSVNQIYICCGYSIAVTAGSDGVIILWDLNSISYIRSIDLKPDLIRLLSVSDTLGDIASISQSDEEPYNKLCLYSINATFIASTTIKEKVTAMCFSSAPEGISVNVIACGLANGFIRFYSTWDLSLVREISTSSFGQAVTWLTYSNDSQLLCACYSDSSIVIWAGSHFKNSAKTPKLINVVK